MIIRVIYDVLRSDHSNQRQLANLMICSEATIAILDSRPCNSRFRAPDVHVGCLLAVVVNKMVNSVWSEQTGLTINKSHKFCSEKYEVKNGSGVKLRVGME